MLHSGTWKRPDIQLRWNQHSLSIPKIEQKIDVRTSPDPSLERNGIGCVRETIVRDFRFPFEEWCGILFHSGPKVQFLNGFHCLYGRIEMGQYRFILVEDSHCDIVDVGNTVAVVGQTAVACAEK